MLILYKVEKLLVKSVLLIVHKYLIIYCYLNLVIYKKIGIFIIFYKKYIRIKMTIVNITITFMKYLLQLYILKNFNNHAYQENKRLTLFKIKVLSLLKLIQHIPHKNVLYLLSFVVQL